MDIIETVLVNEREMDFFIMHLYHLPVPLLHGAFVAGE